MAFNACPPCWIGVDDWQRQIWHESGQYRTRTFLTYEEAEEVLRKYVRLDRIRPTLIRTTKAHLP